MKTALILCLMHAAATPPVFRCIATQADVFAVAILTLWGWAAFGLWGWLHHTLQPR